MQGTLKTQLTSSTTRHIKLGSERISNLKHISNTLNVYIPTCIVYSVNIRSYKVVLSKEKKLKKFEKKKKEKACAAYPVPHAHPIIVLSRSARRKGGNIEIFLVLISNVIFSNKRIKSF